MCSSDLHTDQLAAVAQRQDQQDRGGKEYLPAKNDLPLIGLFNASQHEAID